MTLKSNVYTRIAVKYSDKDILTEEDVDEFFQTLSDSFSEETAQMILSELADDVYKLSRFDVDDAEEYSDGDDYPQDGDRQVSVFEPVY